MAEAISGPLPTQSITEAPVSAPDSSSFSVPEGADPFDAAIDHGMAEFGKQQEQVPGQPPSRPTQRQQPSQSPQGQPPKPNTQAGRKVMFENQEIDVDEYLRLKEQKDNLWGQWYKQNEPKWQANARARKEAEELYRKAEQKEALIKQMLAGQGRGSQPQSNNITPIRQGQQFEQQQVQITPELQALFDDPINGGFARWQWQQNQMQEQRMARMEQLLQQPNSGSSYLIKKTFKSLQDRHGDIYRDAMPQFAQQRGLPLTENGDLDYSQLDPEKALELADEFEAHVGNVDKFHTEFVSWIDKAIENTPELKEFELARSWLDARLVEEVEKHARNPHAYPEPSADIMQQHALQLRKQLLDWNAKSSKSQAQLRANAVEPILPSGAAPKPAQSNTLEPNRNADGDVDWDGLVNDSRALMPPVQRR